MFLFSDLHKRNNLKLGVYERELWEEFQRYTMKIKWWKKIPKQETIKRKLWKEDTRNGEELVKKDFFHNKKEDLEEEDQREDERNEDMWKRTRSWGTRWARFWWHLHVGSSLDFSS